MLHDEIKDILRAHGDYRGLPTFEMPEWKEFTSKYEKDDIRKALADYIVNEHIPFPLKVITKKDVEKRFHNLHSFSCIESFQKKESGDIRGYPEHEFTGEEYELGLINTGTQFNRVSDYYHQENRMACGSVSMMAPLEIWQDQKKLETMNWLFWRDIMGDNPVDEESFRLSFKLGTYTAAQFKPNAAKTIYEMYGADNILDTSCGWGDRLAGFYGTPHTKLYVGCDPNDVSFGLYKKQCLDYDKFLSGKTPELIEEEDYFEVHGAKTVKIWRKPAEDVDWSLYKDTFDVYFTSPPYFCTEKYGTNSKNVEEQSWNRYQEFDAWKYDFLFKVNKMTWPTIKHGGYSCINIMDPIIKSKRQPLCDDMVRDFMTFDDCYYLGYTGFVMSARPHMKQEKLSIEPIWIFRKGINKHETQIGKTKPLDWWFRKKKHEPETQSEPNQKDLPKTQEKTKKEGLNKWF